MRAVWRFIRRMATCSRMDARWLLRLRWGSACERGLP